MRPLLVLSLLVILILASQWGMVRTSILRQMIPMRLVYQLYSFGKVSTSKLGALHAKVLRRNMQNGRLCPLSDSNMTRTMHCGIQLFGTSWTPKKSGLKARMHTRRSLLPKAHPMTLAVVLTASTLTWSQWAACTLQKLLRLYVMIS